MSYKHLLIYKYLLLLISCVDYVNLEEETLSGKILNFPPVIDTNHIYPHPSTHIIDVSIGKNCKGVTFTVPPVNDKNRKDNLYYLWFLDQRLILPGEIKPSYRNKSPISITIDKQFLLSHLENKMKKSLFETLHHLEFFVSDLEYTIPESRYIEDARKGEKYHVDYIYWIIQFNNDPC